MLFCDAVIKKGQIFICNTTCFSDKQGHFLTSNWTKHPLYMTLKIQFLSRSRCRAKPHEDSRWFRCSMDTRPTGKSKRFIKLVHRTYFEIHLEKMKLTFFINCLYCCFKWWSYSHLTLSVLLCDMELLKKLYIIILSIQSSIFMKSL